MTCCLHRIGMKWHAFFAADSTDLCYRIDRSYLVVCVHNGDQTGIISYCVCDLLRGDSAVWIGFKQFNIKSLFF